ncbi:MAG: hypothetical protein ACJASO_002910 [Cyclobacteriaceae bacterium]|jgi:hypothetical protein
MQKKTRNSFITGRIHRFDFLKFDTLINIILRLYGHVMDRKWKKIHHMNAMMNHYSKLA